MNLDELNEYYKKNPPLFVMDDLGVRHINEIELPGNYDLSECECGITHPVESDTWYHEGMKIAENRIAVFRACKKCRCFLMRKNNEDI